jgi:membrane-associated phospholipid phosphatase
MFTLIGFGCFIVWPVRGPRPSFAPGSWGMYGLLTRVDTPLNTFPSMHMAIATYCACVAIELSHGRWRRILAVALPIWVLLIAYSALATKQHYAVDLPLGMLLGLAAERLAWRKAIGRTTRPAGGPAKRGN